MFQCGLRIGEVMGLTFEDLDVIEEGGKYICLAYIRNRKSDQSYQLAKTCMSITDRKQYQQRDYQTRDIGYQVAVIPMDLYDLINDYINVSHEKARINHPNNYFETNAADITTSEYNENNFYIFINSLGRPLSQASWNQIIRKIFKKTGIHLDKKERKHNLSHRFRHGFAMFNVQYLKLNEFELKQRMRHRSLQSVSTYFNPTINDQITLKNEFVDSLYNIYPDLRLGGIMVDKKLFNKRKFLDPEMYQQLLLFAQKEATYNNKKSIISNINHSLTPILYSKNLNELDAEWLIILDERSLISSGGRALLCRFIRYLVEDNIIISDEKIKRLVECNAIYETHMSRGQISTLLTTPVYEEFKNKYGVENNKTIAILSYPNIKIGMSTEY